MLSTSLSFAKCKRVSGDIDDFRQVEGGHLSAASVEKAKSIRAPTAMRVRVYCSESRYNEAISVSNGRG